MNPLLIASLKTSLLGLARDIAASTSPNALKLEGRNTVDLTALILGGKAADSFKLGGKTLNEILLMASGGSETAASVKLALDEFIARRDNPQQVTKAQVALSDVVNAKFATGQESSDGVATNLYMTPAGTTARVQRAIDELVGNAPDTMDTVEKLAAVLANDPEIISTVVSQLNNKLPIDGTAGNSAKLGGKTATDYALVADVDSFSDGLLAALRTASIVVNPDYVGSMTVGTTSFMGEDIFGYRDPQGAGPFGSLTPPTYMGGRITFLTWRMDTNQLSISVQGDFTAKPLNDVLLGDLYIGALVSTSYDDFSLETTTLFDITGLTMPAAGTTLNLKL